MADASININLNSKGAEKSLNTLYADLEATRQELDRLIKTYGDNSKQADNMRKTLAGLETEISKLGGTTDEAVSSNQSLRSELRKVVQELQQLEPGSQRFKDLSIRAGELRDQISDTNAVVGALAGNIGERLFNGITSTVQVGVAGFQAFSSVMALTGVESEELQKTMVKLQALLNLSQSLQTLSALPDEITKIRAAFGSLTTATQAQNAAQKQTTLSTVGTTVAMEGEAVAATGAATATGVLGAALKALPFVAIAAAIGTVIYGLIEYASTSDEAKAAEEERTKVLEEQKKAEEELTSFITKETKELTSLIFQLGATNNGSKERKEMIDEINSTYGLTLKNISDETEFQKQLNATIDEYIKLQYDRFLLEKNQEKIAALNEKRYKAEQALAKLLKDNQKDFRKAGDVITVYSQELQANTMVTLKADETLAQFVDRNSDANKIYRQAKDAIAEAKDEQEKLGISSLKLSNDIDKVTEGGKKYEKQSKNNTKATKEEKEKVEDYSKILQGLQSIIDTNTKVEEENQIKRLELSNQVVNQKDIERRKLEENVRKIYEANRVAINKEVEDQRKKNELLKANEDAYTKFQLIEIEKIKLANEEANVKKLTEQQDLNKKLKLESDALQKEIRFGDGDTTDTKIANDNKYLLARLKSDETAQQRSLIENRVSLKNQVDYFNRRAKLQEEYLQKEDFSNRQALEFERNRLMDLEVQRNKTQTDGLIKYNELTQQYEVIRNQDILKGLEKQKDEQLKILEDLKKQELIIGLTTQDEIAKKTAEQNILDLNGRIKVEKQMADNAILVQDNLNQVKLNLNDELNQKLTTQDAETSEKLKGIQIQRENDIFEARIQKLTEYIDAAQQLFDNFNSIIQEFQDQRLAQEEMALDSYLDFEKTKLDQQLENRLMTQEEYDARVIQLETKREQDLLKLKRKQFKTDKALNLTQATIDGARATLSAFAQTPGDIIIKGIAAAIAAAFAAVQIGLISRQQFVANKGGVVPGAKMENKDSVSAYLTPGEVVINRNSSEQFLPLLDLINRSGGGASLLPDLPASTSQANKFQPVYSQRQNNQPVRAYVVSSDIENNLGKLERIRRSTTF